MRNYFKIAAGFCAAALCVVVGVGGGLIVAWVKGDLSFGWVGAILVFLAACAAFGLMDKVSEN